MKKEIKKIIKIPEGVEIKVEKNLFKVQGPLGETEGKINFKKNVQIEKKEDSIEIFCGKATKKEKKIIGTIKSKLESMIIGVIKGYTYKLEICSVHFPMSITIEEGNFVIKNFIGENKDRIIKIIPGTEVKIEGNIVIVTSVDKEKAGQMAADIETKTRIKRYDRRIFQDGIWIIHKEKGRRQNGR